MLNLTLAYLVIAKKQSLLINQIFIDNFEKQIIRLPSLKRRIIFRVEYGNILMFNVIEGGASKGMSTEG